MERLRSKLAAVVVVLLVWQVAALVASPMALCAASGAAASDGDGCGMPCCKGLAPGQLCPMCRSHGSRPAPGPVWSCHCDVPDAALTSLIGLAGLIPHLVPDVDPLTPSGWVPLSAAFLSDFQPDPFFPPPRA